jgi:hypothetical protein
MRITLPKIPIPSRSAMAILALSLALLVALTFIFVERTKKPTIGKQQPTAQALAFREAATTLFGALSNADQTTKAAHRAMWEYLSNVSQDRLPSEIELKQVVAGASVPYDYQYFFKDCLPRYRAKPPAKTSLPQDPNIILSIRAGAAARSRLYVNQDNSSVAGVRRSVGLDKPGNRIAFAAAYSSPFNIPAGLVIVNGVVVNPILQRFDGIVTMDTAGRLYITSMRRLQDGLRPLNICDNFDDYQQFVKRAVESKVSLIQGTLLVDEGRNALDEKASQRAIARRVILVTEDGGIQVYDSLRRNQALSEVTKILLEKYHAREALNLETGPNNFCLLKDQNAITDYGQVPPGAVLSNIIVIEF